MSFREEINSNKRTARIVGALFLVATVTYMVGFGLLGSLLNGSDQLSQVYGRSLQLVSGVLLEFIDAVAVATIGIMLYPILRKYNEVIGLGYAGTRIIECLLVILAGISSLALIPLSQEYIQAGTANTSHFQAISTITVNQGKLGFQIAMIALGLGSMPFCYLLYRASLIPRLIAVLGLVGYAGLFVGGLVELFGLNLNMIQYVPGGLFELILPVWLIAKGFNSPTMGAWTAKISNLGEPPGPSPEPANS
ncbi:MAG: DUF4386 domain-containing protein [Chloroflexi bacterium]|nr:DUF4386 domain-containing protein [Chloroflexota bacterium]OJV92124.1 MAG: hypothetical protein BGO39_09365 [Chloroflexi bacterium 54-19]